MKMKRIICPDGKSRTYFRGDDQTWMAIINNVVLPSWIDYCNSHWISQNHESIWAAEKRVKSFLDRCAYLISLDNPDGLETDYKRISHKVRELPVTECPPDIQDMLFSSRFPSVSDEDENSRFAMVCEALDEKYKRNLKKRTKRRETIFQRMERIKSKNPDAKLTWCIVDANNCFSYNGEIYKIPDETSGYINKGATGSMDRVLVVDDGSSIQLFNQAANLIDNIIEEAAA